MDLTVKTALPNTPIDWKWPVQVGILPGSAFNIAVLRKYHWAQTLSAIQVLTPGKRMNILLFNGIAETQKAVALFTNKMPQADVILVKMPQAFFNNNKNETDALAIAAKLAQLTKAGGVFFFATAMPDSKWFDTLMIELSHNLGIAAALNKLTPMTGWGFTAPGLEKATQLSAYIEKISTALVSGKFRLTKPVQYYDMKTGFVQTSNHKELGAYFLKNIKTLDYSGEIKTASVVLEVNKALKAMPTSSAKPTYKPITIPVKKGGSSSGKPRTEFIKTLTKKKGGGNIFDWPQTGDSIKTTGWVPPKNKALAKPTINSGGGGAPKKKAAPRLPVKKNGGGIHLPKKKAARPTKKKAETAAPANEKITPRYLQALINEPGSASYIQDHLRPETNYELNIFIGEKLRKAIITDEAFDTGDIFRDPNTKEAEINLELICNTNNKKQYGKLVLPRTGDSGYVLFPVHTTKGFTVFEARISAYHKGRLLQTTILRSDIRKPSGKPALKKIIMKVEAALRSDFSGLDSRQPFGLSITIPEASDTPQPMPGMAGSEPLDLLYDTAFAGIIDEIKNLFENVTGDKEVKKLTDSASSDLLYALASRGSTFYETYFGTFKAKGPVQIISKRREYMPLEFVYTFPPPGLNASLCPNAVKALKQGACLQCCKTKKEWESRFCPFGFWGLSRVIERHSYKEEQKQKTKLDYAVSAEPSAGRSVIRIMNNTQYAESDKVGNGNTGLIKQVNKAITDSSKKPAKATSWNDWRTKVSKGRPESLLLIVHMEKDKRAGDCIEIGKDLLPLNLFRDDYIKGEKSIAPFVVLIGCEVAKVKSTAFDAGNLLTGRGAAIVLSNFTRIRGKQAGEIVIKLTKLLKTLAKKETAFGEVILKLKQQLLAEGIMVGLTLLSYGDADWKITTGN